MSLAQNETFESALSSALCDAKVPSDPASIIGEKYRFGCEHGSHQILCGTVTAIELSDEGGLMLYVSNPRFWNGKLVGLRHVGGGAWSAVVEFTYINGFDRESRTEVESFDGELTLVFEGIENKRRSWLTDGP